MLWRWCEPLVGVAYDIQYSADNLVGCPSEDAGLHYAGSKRGPRGREDLDHLIGLLPDLPRSNRTVPLRGKVPGYICFVPPPIETLAIVAVRRRRIRVYAEDAEQPIVLQ